MRHKEQRSLVCTLRNRGGGWEPTKLEAIKYMQRAWCSPVQVLCLSPVL